MADNILSDFGINILEEEIDDVIFQTNEFLTDATFTGSQGPFWWLPLPILQDTALITVNQPLANSCLVKQNQRGTKTGQNHEKKSQEHFARNIPCGIPLFRLQRYKFVP